MLSDKLWWHFNHFPCKLMNEHINSMIFLNDEIMYMIQWTSTGSNTKSNHFPYKMHNSETKFQTTKNQFIIQWISTKSNEIQWNIIHCLKKVLKATTNQCFSFKSMKFYIQLNEFLRNLMKIESFAIQVDENT